MSRQDRVGWWARQRHLSRQIRCRPASIATPYARRLRLEHLEDRRMLSITVNTLTDEMDGSIIDGDVSLRDAIDAASPGETIDFSVTGTIELEDVLGELTIDKELTITGPGQSLLTIDAGNGMDDDPGTGDGFRIFYIDDGDDGSELDIMLSGLTLTGGDVSDGIGGGGGAIRTMENLTLTDSTVSGNYTTGNGGAFLAEYYADLTLTRSTVSGNSSSGGGFSLQSGGGISVAGDLTLDDSTVTGNSSTGDYSVGGGIYARGVVAINQSTVSGNSTTGDNAKGGGIYVTYSGSLTVTQSTVSDNFTTGANSDGGGIYSRTAAMLIDSTISGNRTEGSSSDGGGIWGLSDVTLTDSTVSGNTTTGNGAGIVANGVTTLTRSTVSGNSSSGSGFSTLAGGGIHASGNLTLDQSTVSGNFSSGNFSSGGGIYSKGVVTVNQSTVSGNYTTGDNARGGGIYVTYSGSVTLTQSTVSGNYTSGSNSHGGGVYARGDLTVNQSTITDNEAMHATAIGGGIGNFSKPMEISGSILAGNSAGGGNPDLNPGTGMLSVNYSLIGTGITPDVGTSGNNVVADNPMVDTLSDNGGPTETHALLAGSPAIDMGELGASPGVADVPLYDQRGNNYGRVQNGRIDIGAYELRATLSADFDSDGFITGDDFLAWQRGFGTVAPDATKPDGDGDNDLDVDSNDLGVWESQYGQAAPLVAASSTLAAVSFLSAPQQSRLTVSDTAPQPLGDSATTTPTSTELASVSQIVSSLSKNIILRPDSLALWHYSSTSREERLVEKDVAEHFDLAFDEAWNGVDSLTHKQHDLAGELAHHAKYSHLQSEAHLADDLFAGLAEQEGLLQFATLLHSCDNLETYF